MKPATSPSALKVQAALGPRFEVLEFDAGTRTAEDAAAAIGCTAAEIAKSLVFRAASGRPVLVVASGAHRIDESLMTFPEVWAAAGTPNAVFRLTPADLVPLTGGTVAAVKRQ